MNHIYSTVLLIGLVIVAFTTNVANGDTHMLITAILASGALIVCILEDIFVRGVDHAKFMELHTSYITAAIAFKMTHEDIKETKAKIIATEKEIAEANRAIIEAKSKLNGEGNIL
jgi:sorbitol-specific phosphotransferase system component IIBC